MTRSRIARWLVAALLGVATLAQAQRATDLLRARRIVRAVEARTERMAQAGSGDPTVLRSHLLALEDAARLAPADVAVPIARGNQYLLLGAWASAIEAYRAAQRLERRPETHVNLAHALKSAGCPADSRREIEWAARLDPAVDRQLGEEAGPRAGRGLIFEGDFECGWGGWGEPRTGGDAESPGPGEVRPRAK